VLREPAASEEVQVGGAMIRGPVANLSNSSSSMEGDRPGDARVSREQAGRPLRGFEEAHGEAANQSPAAGL